MKTITRPLIILVLTTLLTTQACSSNLQAPASPMPPELPETLAAKTWSAMQTSAALSATATLLPPSDTPLPSETPTITNTPTATRTQVPQLTALPTLTPQPTSTPTVVPRLTSWYQPGNGGGGSTGGGGGGGSNRPCLAARLVRDVTIPNGMVMLPNEHFIKVWKIENVGSCIWDKQIKFVPSGSNPFTDNSTSVPGNVRPGKTIEIAVDLITPSSIGTYTGKWYLSANGKRFGDKGNDNPFKAVVEVQDPLPSVMFDFSQHLCQASWQSNARTSGGKVVLGGAANLSCPGKTGNPIGFVRRIDTPEMETGSETGPAILSNPPKKTDGAIEGVFPAILVHSGDHFTTQIGCRQGEEECDVRFELTVKVISPPNTVISQDTNGWQQTYDGTMENIDLDLSSLAGNYVQIVLRVRANNNSDENAAIWVRPQISR